jgi:hypothetical protein
MGKPYEFSIPNPNYIGADDPEFVKGFVYQIFLNGDMVGAALAADASDALLLAERSFDKATSESWSLVAVDEERAHENVEVVGEDGMMEVPFVDVISNTEYLPVEPVWVFRCEDGEPIDA